MANLLDQSPRKTETEASEELTRNNGLYLAILGTWFCFNLILWSDLLAAIKTTKEPVPMTLVLLLTCAVSLGGLFGSYHLGLVIFSLIHSTSKVENISTSAISPLSRIAILHTVCDDFQEGAALTCVHQSYCNFHVYLLDDSVLPEQKKRVDEFQATFAERVTVIRRQNRKGFKAGNINNALGHLESQYKYVALADSDTHLPHDFLAKTCILLEANPSSAFVQTLHIANSGNEVGTLPRHLQALVRIGWKYYQPIRNQFGLPMCYGHGALIRCDAIEEAGGFPEIVSEDIALTLKLRQLGYRGFFTSSVVCGEDYPENYYAFRKRLSRWVSADLECTRFALLPFLSTKGISWTEKADATLRGLKVPAAALFLPFAATAALLSIFSSSWNELFTNRIVYMTLVFALAPFFSFTIDLAHQPKRLALLLSRITFLYCSNSLLLTGRAIEALIFKKSEFFVTGAEDERVSVDNLRRRLLTLDKAGYPLLAVVEVALGLALSIVGFFHVNLILAGIGLALILAPVTYAYGWDKLLVSYLIHAPITLIVAGIVISCFLGLGPATQCLALAGLSILLF